MTRKTTSFILANKGEPSIFETFANITPPNLFLLIQHHPSVNQSVNQSIETFVNLSLHVSNIIVSDDKLRFLLLATTNYVWFHSDDLHSKH